MATTHSARNITGGSKNRSARKKGNMTPKEQAELDELGITPEQLAERQKKVAATIAPATPNGTRRRRSDAGKPRAKASEPVLGMLTEAQANRLGRLVETLEAARERMANAEADYLKHRDEFTAYLDELQGKR